MRGKELKNTRLANLQRLHRSHTLEEIAKKSGTDPVYLSQILNGVIGKGRKTPRSISDDYAEKIEHGLGLPHRWMDQPHGGDESTSTTSASIAIPPPGSRVAVWETLEDLPEGANYVQVPHYEVAIAAGDGCQWVDHADNEPLVFRARWFVAKGIKPQDCRALYVRGDSMAPTLNDGDTVMIDASRTQIRDDVIYALAYHNELYIKRLFRLPGGGLELRSDNPRHPSRTVTGSDLDAVHLLGEMVWRAG